FPDATVVIDHFARIGADGMMREQDVASLVALARRPHVYVKLSAYWGLGAGAPPYDDLAPMIRRLLDAFGPDRLMWASDGPYGMTRGSYPDAVALVRDRLDFLTP